MSLLHRHPWAIHTSMQRELMKRHIHTYLMMRHCTFAPRGQFGVREDDFDRFPE